ncbi:small subunit processome component 20 homolog [Onthophagus taurus]|uniref:small subunit processome component 20 homolog n=1 Tax=Onthophagus taurus TaxID=166361 RepID=UPI0039BEB60F
MKNKSTRHKDDNTFKFVPFSERINNVDINVFHRIGHENEEETDEIGCYFNQAIQKWNVLNLSEHYGKFKKEVKAHLIVTLPQLVHNKENIVEVLIKYLKEKNILSLQPLLELVVALAQDLRNDFYEYYQNFLDIIISLLNTKDVEQLEWTFTCLAYLFKILWRILLKNINVTFNTLIPLLSDDKPQYINNFAAESFAFVTRKVKDKKAFLLLIIKSLKHNKDSVSGCGKLLFEVISTVQSSFHSNADQWLPCFIEILQEKSLPNVWYEVLEEVVKNIVENIRPNNNQIFWETFICEIDKFLLINSEKSTQNLNFLLKCIGIGVEFKGGIFLKTPSLLVQTLLKILNSNNLNESVLMTSIKITILLLLSKNIKLQQEESSSLIRFVLSLDNKKLLLYFIENVFECALFEALILPAFLKFTADSNLDKDYLKVLTKLIVKKSPLCVNGINLNSWMKYNLRFGSKQELIKIEEILFKKITLTQGFNEEEYIYSMICLPHLSLVENVNVLMDNIKVLSAKIQEKDGIEKNLFLFGLTFESLVHIKNDEIEKLFDIFMGIILPLSNQSKNIIALQSLDLFLTALGEGYLNKELLKQLNVYLELNFSSPIHEVRLYTTHIYSLFDKFFTFENTIEDWNVFSLCYNVESIEPLVHTYREQLMLLEKLNFDKPQIIMCKETEFVTIPLRFLCGILYVNFKLLWEPVTKIISTYALGMEINKFWNIFSEELKGVCDKIRNMDENLILDEIVNYEFLNNLYKNVSKIGKKADFANYRVLLWKSMQLFPEIAEAKTRDTSVLLLNFIEQEYTNSNTDTALTWNIKQNELMEVDNEDENEQIESEEKIKNELKISPPLPKGKTNLKTLLQHLLVFSKVRSPKSMYREPELYRLYFDFLSHKNPDVQKAALDCLMTYKFKYLTPYSEHLYKLIDEKNFKNELVMFRIDQESPLIQNEHRKDLIPVVMKLVFSKMVVKTGLRTGGKSNGGQLRRNLVFRFLAGCNGDEMKSFIKMTFKFYDRFLGDDLETMVKKVIGEVNLEKCIPPKRLQSCLNMINVILEQFGGLMDTDLLRYLLKLVFFIGSLLRAAQENHSQIHAGYFGILRNLRGSSLKIINRFFELFDMYPWNANEINAVFDVFIWPYLNKLTIEGIHSPTNLLKLLACWGSNPRYFNLLVKHSKLNPEEYSLPVITKLLINEKTHPSVSNLIMEMIEKLLTLQPNEDDLNNKIPIEDEVKIKDDLLEQLKVDEKLNYGSCILLPHVTLILQKIKRRLEIKSKTINQRDLFILMRLSELVTESEICDKLLQLLFPVILKKSVDNTTPEETLLQMVSTLNNLISKVEQPEKHLKQLSPLFSEVTYPSSRKILCNILDQISNSSEKYKTITELIKSLNAWDQKWVDQPDFKTRSETFKTLLNMINEKSINIELGILLIYNNFYYLKNVSDISLKEHATHSLKTLSPYLVNTTSNYSDRLYILDETLFNLIRSGLKSKNNDYRNECILILGYLARESPEAHVVLRDLNKLTNKQDLEVDFFENITHLQTHRHGRALQRFCNVFKECDLTPNVRTMTQFILPLTTYYLCNEKYSGKNSVIDSSIETIGIISRLLPWQQYEGLLKFYLNKLKKNLQYQKQIVRLIVNVLDSFHFDLNKGYILENSKEDLRKINQNDEKMEIDEINNLKEDNKGDVDVDIVLNEDKDDEIDEVLGEIPEEADKEIKETNIVVKPYEKITVLSPSAALRIINTIKNILLPQLNRCLAEMTHHETSHKVNRKKTSMEREEEDLLRVPISLALVKLLQKLPKTILDANISGILLKLCTFLKSQLESVRRVTRESLQKIMLTLGPSYLKLLFDEMVPLLPRGFQVHVLVYTVHAVLCCMKDIFTPGDVDKILPVVIKLCNTDLFGVLSEEKEIKKITTKVSEAKSSKSMDTFKILAQFITKDSLRQLVNPIKDILTNTHSYKIVNKIQEAFKQIALGLIDNKYVEIDAMLKFSFDIVFESTSEIKASEIQSKLSEKEIDRIRREKPDCFIIPKEPVYKSGYRTTTLKASNMTNIHVMVEFGLKICYFLLKRDILKGNVEDRRVLDDFVPIMKECLESKNIKLTIVTLQCLPWIFKHDLPSLHDNIESITEIIFKILHKYAASGLSKGDNFDLVVASFKAVTVLVRDLKFHVIKPEQLKILLLYIEQDLHDYDRQATAYGLLKALLSRKFSSPEIYDIMKKVMELSIISELPHIRSQSRSVAQQFMLDYPIGKKLDTYLSFYLSQLKFELQTGRESAIEMIQNLITSLPISTLKENSGTFFITLGARLVNDPQPTCRKMIGDCLQTMLKILPKSDRDPLFDILILWLNDNIISHRRLSAQICGIFVQIEKAQFESRLDALLPLVITQFESNSTSSAGRFVKLKKETEDNDEEESERLQDHFLFQLLQMLLKICNNCPGFFKRLDDIENISNHVQVLLAYPHEWVRLASAQFLGFVLNSIEVDKLSLLMIENKTSPGYLYSDPINCLKSLTLDLCDQLQPNSIKNDLAEQVVKNLIFIARVLDKISGKNLELNLTWLTKRMRKIVYREIIEAVTSTTLRMEIFKWIAGVAIALSDESVLENVHHLMAPLVREMVTTDEKEAPLRQLSKEVGGIIKKKIGVEKYTEVLAKVQQQLSVKRAERKRTRTQLAVTDPELYAKKKIKHHEKKKETRKRKISQRKGVKRKFRKKETIDLDSSEIL